MKKAYPILRVLFGIILIVFGLNGFLQFMGGEMEFSGAAESFMTGLMASGYIMQLMSALFLLAGISFIFNMYSALFAVLLAPFSANILLFHIFLEPAGMMIAVVFALLNIIVLWMNMDKYKPMLQK